MMIPRIVDVHFGGVGVETYDRINVNDVACWEANAEVWPQLNVVTRVFVEIPDDQDLRIRAFHRLCRMRRKSASKLGLSLRNKVT